mmetsp:Transcript_13892/g.20608  ORF Transcript_13892/g.20608 Transcript_13892/m.20608 type:complete len:98 (-) Transcript_13892:13-306(-)
MDGVRTNRVFKQVPDFETDENGRTIMFRDPVMRMDALEQRNREDWIAIEHLNIVRRRLTRCYREQGPNHFENCKEVAKEYLALYKAPKYGALYAQKK